jgi:PIN domain nuclease of toxin-antitoxin system
MIMLDTHIWVWWIHNDSQLTDKQREFIQKYEDEGLGVSIFFAGKLPSLLN